MPEKSKTEAAEVQFPLNRRLLEEAAKIKEERRTIRERIKKIEASKSQVSGTVYEKVKSDYMTQLNNNTNALLEKKQDIDRELATLYEAKKKVEENVETHRHRVEEINFRNNLGEYKGEEFNKLSTEENGKLSKFEKILAAIESNIKQYDFIFEGEEGLGEEAAEMEEAPPPPPPGELESEAPISMEEAYEVGGEEGYFGVETEEVEAGEDIHEETNKEIRLSAKGKVASLTITEGDGKGDIFKMEGDELTIGRASSNNAVLKEAKVSRQHAIIKKRGKEYLIEDLHSSNGVFVNNEKVKEQVLSNGDTIKIGDFVMKFSC